MNKTTLSAIVALSLISCPIHSMHMDAELYSQTQPNNTDLWDNSFYYINPFSISLFGTAGAMGLQYLYNKSFKSNTAKTTPNTHCIWIKTSDDKMFLMDIKKDLPPCGLQYLLKKYKRQFSHHYSKEKPLKTACSLSDYQLLGTALNAINHNMLEWNFTEAEQTTLLEIASSFKTLSLYLALIHPSIETNSMALPDDVTKKLTPLLIMLNKKPISIWNTIAMFATPSTKQRPTAEKQPLKDRAYTEDKKHYIIHRKLHDAETNDCIMKIPKHTTWKLLPNKKMILLSSTKLNSLYIYDIGSKNRHHLPITSLNGCHSLHVSPDENYIATFSGAKSNEEYKESLIHVWDMSDVNNPIYYAPQHHAGVTIICFSPKSTHLISGADYSNIYLWDLKKFSEHDTLSTLLLCNDTIDQLIFNKDKKTLAIQHSPDTFCYEISIINIETLSSQTVIPTAQCPSSIFAQNSDLIMFSTYNQKDNQSTFNIITKEGIELYSTELPKDMTNNSITYIMSNNNQHIAINNVQKHTCDILTIDDAYNITTKSIGGFCSYIENDGSFYTHSSHSIRVYDPKIDNSITMYHNPKKSLSTVKIMPDERIIEYSYLQDYKPKQKGYRHLLDTETYKNMYYATSVLTPLQYLLIKAACEKPRKNKKSIQLKQNSLQHLALKSFGKYEALITKTLKLKITDK